MERMVLLIFLPPTSKPNGMIYKELRDRLAPGSGTKSDGGSFVMKREVAATFRCSVWDAMYVKDSRYMHSFTLFFSGETHGILLSPIID